MPANSDTMMAEIAQRLNEAWEKTQDPATPAADVKKYRKIIDELLDAREDIIFKEYDEAIAKVANASARLEKLMKKLPASPFTQMEQTVANAAPSPPQMTTSAAAGASGFDGHIASLNLRYFKPYEFLEKGGANGNPASPAFGLNTDPPADLWKNIDSTARVIDELRHQLQATIILTSVYRSPAYNQAVGGASNSLHMSFNAIDFVVRGITTGPQDWANLLRQMRSANKFSGGVGVYPSFVHVDTRGTNVDW